MTRAHRIFGITGWKNSGKTTLVARLVSELSGRGLTVSTIKHAHHSFDIDHEGTDSWKHRKAGTLETALVSANRWAIMHELKDQAEPPLADILERLSPCDLVLIEGYKREGHDKIEVLRGARGRDEPLWPADPSIVAVASDHAVEGSSLPHFSPDQIAQIADFILAHLASTEKAERTHATR
ncbi:MAG: molybdopterin-guanine dinucleotide biosynthesis protein B [Rhizobiaceae bacterium]